MSASDIETVLRLCSDLLAPLVGQDEGELYLVDLSPERVALHLAGKCSGCPGTGFTTAEVIEPAIRALAPNIEIVVTAGIRLPAGAKRLASGTNVARAPDGSQPRDNQ